MSLIQHGLLFCSLGALFFGYMTQIDFRAGIRIMQTSKGRVKQNSFLRKILPFKDTEDNPYLYIKIVPLLINIIITIIVLIIYIFFWIFPASVLGDILGHPILVLVSMVYCIGTGLYYAALKI